MPLTPFDPLVRDWLEARFAAVTEPQRLGWPHIRAGGDVLISAPTGAGKTLAAFLTAIDSLLTSQWRHELRIHCCERTTHFELPSSFQLDLFPLSASLRVLRI